MQSIIKVVGLSKQYRLGQVGTGSIKHDMVRWWDKARGREDRFLKIGETNDRTTIGDSEYVWALKDISFEVNAGEVLGIIGRNGAGKSTLLKILSRVTEPTMGRVEMHGRVASLLEVGTGFHPDLTGRENIYLNGAILGMTKREVSSKFDEIVDFAGVERYIDTPVKRYSSGMHVRLGFAVAAHLEPEILIVDEVLAVGDAEFQKKCLGKMKEVSVNNGRTVLFVSHNLNMISNLCNKGVFLKNGTLFGAGSVQDMLELYSEDRNKKLSNKIEVLKDGKSIWVTSFEVQNLAGTEKIEATSSCIFKVSYESKISLQNVYVGIGINDVNEVRVLTVFSKFYNKTFDVKIGANHVLCELSALPLKPGTYFIEIFIGTDYQTLDYYSNALQIEVSPLGNSKNILPDSSQGYIIVDQVWKT
jgi:lipopolysaccharide transport system ATP-binding protein